MWISKSKAAFLKDKAVFEATKVLQLKIAELEAKNVKDAAHWEGCVAGEKYRSTFLEERGTKYAAAITNMEKVITESNKAIIELASKAVEKVPTKINNTNKQ